MTTTRVVPIALALASGLVLSSCRFSLPPRDPATPADFTITQIATKEGTAFTITGEFAGDRKHQEILNTVFTFTPFGTPGGGEVTLYRKVGADWVGATVISAAENIRNPNRPTIADVDGDGRNDFIQPAGWFLNSAFNDNTGSITWWRNNGNGSFSRNNVILDSGGAYEGVAYADLDNDGIKDMVSTFQDFGNPFISPGTPPTVKLEFFRGLGAGRFAAPVTLCACGGPLPVLFDVNNDGKLDIASAQYLGVATVANPAAGLSDESFIWLENTARTVPGKGKGPRPLAITGTSFVKHVIARGLGESVQILPVDNLDGDNRYGAIGVNQVNPVSGDPNVPPQVVRLTPGADIRAEWNVEVIYSGFTLERTGPGSTSPGPIADGDFDGDGDIDLIAPGSADTSIYWLERRADGSWTPHDIAAEFGVPGSDYGLGGVILSDLDLDGRNELVFSAYYASSVNVVSRVPQTGGKVPALPRVPDRWYPYTY
jgi:hypothetical protein